MESARKLLRSASRRIRRVSRNVEETDLGRSSPKEVDPKAEASTSMVTTAESPLEAGELAAAAAKLSDLESSTEDVRGSRDGNEKQDYIDQLFIKQRRELNHELRQIQNSHRPVSKGDQRRNIDRFLRQHLHGDVSDSISEGSNEGSNQSPRRRRRNGIVMQELEGLSQQQSVTQRLRCPTFRRDLENMVRGVVIRQEREVEAALRLRTAGLPGNRRLPLAGEAGGVDTRSSISAVSSVSSGQSLLPSVSMLGLNGIPAAPPLPPFPGQHHIPAPPPPPTQQHHQPQNATLPPPPPPPPPQQQQQQQANRWPMPTAPWLVQNSVNGTQGPPNRVQVLQQVQREAVVSEISELVHRQLVQETLESDFRGRLEFLMMNRLETIGPESGERVMNFLNTIPQSQHIRRNDFSHLGIHAPSTQRDDGLSGAVGGATVPAAFIHEMDSLKSKMSELHEMVRMSMEMQLDLQRAIRQEVAAALHQQNGTAVSPAAPISEPASEGNCIICLDKEVDAVLYQCGHMCVCLTCGLRLSTMGSHCPMCRAPIRDVIRAYRCQRT
nr:formin-G-like [Lytechinus pictus]